MHDQHDRERHQLVSFILDGEEFGVDILNVQEIIRTVTLTRVPSAPAFVEGVINLRGRIVPVVDLRKRFGLTARAVDKETRIIVVELSHRVVGFLVDEVREVIRVPAGVTEPPPEFAAGVDAAYITGVAKLDGRLLILLDLEQVLSAPEHAAVAALREAA